MKRREAIKSTLSITGYALSATVIAGVMNGCRAKTTSGWKPEFLSKDQGLLLMELTESIIPATDTPGAKDVGVHEFIDRLLNECLSNEEQTLFTSGLIQLEADCKELYGMKFIDTTESDRKAILDAYDQKAYDVNHSQESSDLPFFTMAKQLTYLGYFTSEKIGTEVLRYDPIPQSYDGCIPYEQGDRVWSL